MIYGVAGSLHYATDFWHSIQINKSFPGYDQWTYIYVMRSSVQLIYVN